MPRFHFSCLRTRCDFYTSSIFLIAVLLLLILEIQIMPALAEQKDKEAVAGVPANFSPQYQVDAKGKPYGFAIDVMNEVARRSGIKVRYVVYKNFSDVLAAMQSGKINVIPNVGITEKRKKYSDFTVPIETSNLRIFVRNTPDGITNIDELTGRKVGVVAENQGFFILKERVGPELMVYNSMDEALMSLISGNTDAMVYPEEPLLRAARQSGIEGRIKPAGKALAEIKRAIGIRKGQTELYFKLDETVKAFVHTPEFERLYLKWYGSPESYWNETRIITVAGIILALTAILFFIIHYISIFRLNRKLRASENKYRKLHESMTDAFVSVDMRGRIREFNGTYLNMLGSTETEIINLTYSDLTPEKWHDYEAKIVKEEVLSKGYSGVYEKEYRRKDGTVFPVELRTFLIRDDSGQPSVMWSIVRDVTARKKAEEALHKSEELLHTVLNNAPITIFAIDDKGIFTLSEGKSLEKVNLKSGENVGVSALDLFATLSIVRPDGEILNGRELIRRVLAGETLTGITELKGVSFANQFVPYCDAQGRIIGMIGIATIITERLYAEKALRRSEESYRTLIENISLGVCLIDKDYKIKTINKAFCKMFGVAKNEVIGKYCYEVCAKSSSICSHCPGTECMNLKKAVKIESECVCADGTRLPVILHTYPVLDLNNEAVAFIKISEDISEYKKVEQAKKNLIRDMSHSLKTPVAMTEMALDIIKKSIDSNDKESIKKANKIAAENLEKLRKDITNILQEFSMDVHKDVVGKKDKKASLNSAMAEIAKNLKLIMENKNIQLEINIPLNADKIKMEDRDIKTIMNNLLDNAVKFTDTGKILVSSALKDKMVEIEVMDTGCGISVRDINRVFDKFYKRHASIDGTGLGLSICKELVEMYGGEINIYSEGVGKGSTVVVSLPQA